MYINVLNIHISQTFFPGFLNYLSLGSINLHSPKKEFPSHVTSILVKSYCLLI